MNKSNAIRANYFEIKIDEANREVFLQFRPPSGTNSQLIERKAIVVVDCSGSMSGGRIKKANNILSHIYSTANVTSLEIIKFGTDVQGPFSFDKTKKQDLATIDADLGGTDFIPAMTSLLTLLKNKSASESYFVIFLSDGEAEDPTELYAPVKQELQRINAPLLSLAISNQVNPYIMVNLANLNGNLGLCLINDNQIEAEYLPVLVDYLPIGVPIDELTIYLKSKKGEILQVFTEKYRRNAEIVAIEFKSSDKLENCYLEGKFENQKYEFILTNVTEMSNNEEKIECVNNFLMSRSKAIIGKFIVKEIGTEEAKEKIAYLRKLYLNELDEGKKIDEIIKSCSTNGEQSGLTQDGKIKMKKLKQFHKTMLLNTMTHLNKCTEIVNSNDLKSALEAYSGKAISMKFNKRIQQIALKNQQKEGNDISLEFILAYLASDNKPLPECIYWIQNVLEADKDELAELDQGEWVGNGILVLPGNSAALNPWNIDKVYFRPIKITNSVVNIIKDKIDNPRNKALLKGFEGEFNTSLPLLSPDEHKGAVRLIIECMRKTTNGQKQISQIFTNTNDLFNSAMIDAIYVMGTLNTLQKAKTGIEFELAFKSFLTIVDQVLVKSPLHNSTEDFWANFLNNLLTKVKRDKEDLFDEKHKESKILQGNNLISSKEASDLPNITKAFIPLLCTQKAYLTDISQINWLFCRLFARLVVENSSGKYQLEKMIGISSKNIDEIASDLIEKSKGKRIEIPVLEKGKSEEEIKLYTDKLAEIYYIHMEIRLYLQENKLDFKDFFTGIINAKIDIVDGKIIFQKVMEKVSQGQNQFIKTIFETNEPEKIVSSINLKACENHVGKTLPLHDGNDIKRVLNSFETTEELEKAANEVVKTYFANIFGKICFRANKLIKRKKKVVKFIEKAIQVNEYYVLERLELDFQNDTLSFSNHHDHFSHRGQMFNFLKYWAFDSKDLHELMNQKPEFFHEFDLEKWIQSHRGYLPGFSKFYKINLETCNSKDSFIHKMLEDLNCFYEGKNGATKREFTDKMKNFLPLFAGHFWEEHNLHSLIRTLKEQNKAAEEVFEHIVANLAELKELSPLQVENRKGHIRSVIENAFKL